MDDMVTSISPSASVVSEPTKSTSSGFWTRMVRLFRTDSPRKASLLSSSSNASSSLDEEHDRHRCRGEGEGLGGRGRGRRRRRQPVSLVSSTSSSDTSTSTVMIPPYSPTYCKPNEFPYSNFYVKLPDGKWMIRYRDGNRNILRTDVCEEYLI
ncbi:hypothetical protein EC973_002137 [Apophysomyces ossiformis]|uniref:Uncharacterized protein n=1 Tax=Apophysomyces ossiformis TaxID=679940 RepID=A0A8H7BST5_9FUNG|nr:hypothetical protein EC973_002137 [Apophysomyces ossiformis]